MKVCNVKTASDCSPKFEVEVLLSGGHVEHHLARAVHALSFLEAGAVGSTPAKSGSVLRTVARSRAMH
jgi:hypothetical protein